MTRTFCAIMAAMLVTGCGFFRDWNGDGVRLVACGGDSNTAQLHRTGWCNYLRHELAADDVRTRASAWAFTQAVDSDRIIMGLPMSSKHWVDLMLKWNPRPDVAILAWGTNDVGVHATDEIVDALAVRADRLRGESIGVLIATVPHAFGDAEHNRLVDEINLALVERFDPCLVDFTTKTPPTKKYHVDRLHLNDVGLRIWAKEAARALRTAPVSCHHP